MVDKNNQIINIDQALKSVSYELTDGTNFELTLHEVKSYLVQGHADLVTIGEFVWFMQKCKALKMNPYLGDVYLIKFSANEKAGLVVSVDYKRKLAMRQPGCQGWNRGIVVMNAEKNLVYRNGIVIPGDILLGGWFEATPGGWNTAFKLEVSLAGAIKKTRNGDVTSFWKLEKQPDMIAKVAESRGLSSLWGEDLQGLTVPGELATEDVELVTADAGKKTPVYEVKTPPKEDLRSGLTADGKAAVKDLEDALEPDKCSKCNELITAPNHICEQKEQVDSGGLAELEEKSLKTQEAANAALAAREDKPDANFDLFTVTGHKDWGAYLAYASKKKMGTFEGWCDEQIKLKVWFHAPADVIEPLIAKHKRFYKCVPPAWGRVDTTTKSPADGEPGGDPLNLNGGGGEDIDPNPLSPTRQRQLGPNASEGIREAVGIWNNLTAEDADRMLAVMKELECLQPASIDEFDELILGYHELKKAQEGTPEPDGEATTEGGEPMVF